MVWGEWGANRAGGRGYPYPMKSYYWNINKKYKNENEVILYNTEE